MENHSRIDARSCDNEFFDKLIVEDVLRHAHEEGASERLTEHDQCGSRRDVFEGQDGLDGDEGLLHAKTNTEAINDLIPNPHGVVGGDLPRSHETSSNRHEDGAGIDERCIIANGSSADS